jgi:muramoyltetrapeptide carboxypeptidase
MPIDMMRLPRLLPAGGTIAVVAPSSPGDPARLAAGVAALESEGYTVRLGAHVGNIYGHHAGSAVDRARDINTAFTDPEVDAILCARGGSGSIRILPYLDYAQVKRDPKPFIGYSDVTSVLLALHGRAGLPTVFGPMVGIEFSRAARPSGLDTLWRLLCHPEPAGVLRAPADLDGWRCLHGGIARGPLVGGTLALVAATLGTPHQIDLSGAIFFFEDVNESPARVERYLAQLLQAGLLRDVAGFLIGDAPYDEADRERFLTLEQVYADLLLPLEKPLVYNFPIGHHPDPIPLPLGIQARLDADQGLLSVEEAFVARNGDE